MPANSLRKGELVIDESSDSDVLYPVIDGERVATGCVERDFSVQPPKMQALEIPEIPESEWDARIEELAATKSQLSDIRLRANNGAPIPSLDQGQYGYCWSHSPTHAAMLVRALANLPYVPLSAFSIAAPIKNGRNEGGWAALALDYGQTHGWNSQRMWPQGDARVSRNTTEAKEERKKYQATEAWEDLAASVYDRNVSFKQMASLLLSKVPGAGDFYWWSHSVALLDLVKIEAGSYGIRIWNSWTDQWGDRGMGVLRGSKARTNGAVFIRSLTAAA